MRSESGEAEFLRGLFHHVPDYALRYAVTPMFACSADASKQPPGRNFGSGHPHVDGRFDPVGHRYGSNVSAFADEIDDGPMFLALLQMRELQIGQFAAPESAAKQDGENCPVPFTFERVRVRNLPESAGFFNCEPVSKPHAQLLGPFHASDAGGKLRTEQPSVGGLVRKPTYCSEPSIDRARRKLTIFEENTVAGDHNLVKRQARLGAVPLNEFVDSVPISALRLGCAKAIQDRRFAVIQIREAELCFRPL